MSSGNNSSGSPVTAPQLRWAALAGLWTFEERSAIYKGPSSDAPQAYGIALSNWNLTDGSVSVRIKFSQIDTAGNTSAGLLLGFSSERSRYVIAQLGGYGRAYSVAEWLPGIIFEDIKRHISEAKIVIAEITAPNQNVFYELGYAHALNKPTILLAQRGKELPFDIRSYRVIFYDDTIGGKPAVEQALQKHLETILHEG